MAPGASCLDYCRRCPGVTVGVDLGANAHAGTPTPFPTDPETGIAVAIDYRMTGTLAPHSALKKVFASSMQVDFVPLPPTGLATLVDGKGVAAGRQLRCKRYPLGDGRFRTALHS